MLRAAPTTGMAMTAVGYFLPSSTSLIDGRFHAASGHSGCSCLQCGTERTKFLAVNFGRF
jgi:hypothetical protein